MSEKTTAKHVFVKHVDEKECNIITRSIVTRPSFDTYFLDIAIAVSKRADCRRAQHGAVIVKDYRVVSTGYNAAPSGGPSCLNGECPRGLLTYEETEALTGGYDSCIAQHAEGNAIAFASHSDTNGATIYITGQPCIGCWKNIQAAGIIRAVWSGEERDVTQMRWPYG